MTKRQRNLRKSMVFAIDCLAVLAGALIAAPFALVALSPFVLDF